MNRDWKKLIEAAEDQGWTVERTKRGAYKLVPPDVTKQIVFIHQTPSEVRAIRNKIAEMKRSGLIWPPPKKGKG